MNAIPDDVIQHCQQHPGCQGCTIREACATAITTTSGFKDLMTAALTAIETTPRSRMTDAEFINALGIPGLGDAA
jgi:hypothetical protein